MNSPKSLKMKTIKIAIAVIIIALIAFLIFYKTDKINIGGIWTSEKIILEGQTIYPHKIDSSLMASSPKIIINDWADSLYIYNGKDTIRANFKIKKDNSRHQIRLSSSKNSLNGNFSLEIDTLYLGPLAYTIYVNIESDKTLLNFKQTVHREPQQVKRHKRGIP